ncbi:MAG: hypothetical protein R3A44_25465 [Caldilineaceae bacterium]
MEFAPAEVGVLDQEATGLTLKNFGKGRLSDIFDDFVIYRDLEPLDRRLPGLKAAAGKMGLSDQPIPRKREMDYARAASWFAEKAQSLRNESKNLAELLFLGDSLYNDGEAFQNLCELTEWQGACFIGNEKGAEEPAVEMHGEQRIYCANRWSALGDWAEAILKQGLALDERTLVIVDIDKTALGAKGRNDSMIDHARLEGIYRTMDSVLGANFDRAAFEKQYAELNRSSYHCVTADNQDFLAYICLVLNAQLIQFEEFVDEVNSGHLDNFFQFTRWVNSRMMINPIGSERLRQVHETVMNCEFSGDPTPFKSFRRQEFITTVARMGQMRDETPVDELLQQEITLTNEVMEISKWLAARGCLLMCMSDKPSESACPDRHESADLPPLHRVETHLVGATIQAQLAALG